MIHWNRYNTLKLGNNTANKETSKQTRHVFRAKITEKPNELENTNYKTCHVILSNSTSQNAENSQRGQRLTVFKLSYLKPICNLVLISSGKFSCFNFALVLHENALDFSQSEARNFLCSLLIGIKSRKLRKASFQKIKKFYTVNLVE